MSPLKSLLVLLLGLSLVRAEPKPQSAEPEKNQVPQAAEWSAQCAARVAAIRGQRCDLIFIGDSMLASAIRWVSRLVGRMGMRMILTPGKVTKLWAREMAPLLAKLLPLGLR